MDSSSAAAAKNVSSDQLKEYESQLADVKELLKASPNDESLLSLQSDLEELLALERASLTEEQQQAPTTSGGEESSTSNDLPLPPPPPPPPPEAPPLATAAVAAETTESTVLDVAAETNEPPVDAPPAASLSKKAKKKKKLKDFVIPDHLVPLDSDTEGEKNRKRRAIKALKNKWREQKKDVESSNKQQSWQSFQGKKKRKEKSIFATQDGVNAKVGVTTAGRSMTEYGERKRHKHE